MKLCLFLLLQSVVVAKTWIECEYNAKALNLSMMLSRKHEVVAKAWIKHINSRESLYAIKVAFGYKKNNPARRAGQKKIILLRFCPKKIFL